MVKRIDMRPFIGTGISASLYEWEYFKQVAIDEGGGIYWPNGYDFCPEFLHDEVADMTLAQQLAHEGGRETRRLGEPIVIFDSRGCVI